MKQKSLIKNVIYNFLYTGLNLFFPLITSPYISRILGAENLGKVNFATSIINWFILFASLGVSSYGVREIAKNRDDMVETSKIFSELLIINAVLSVIVTIIYVYCIFSVPTFSSERPLHLIMTISIILNMLSIDWFYQGIEEYRYITIRSGVIKVISLIFIFLFVLNSNDYIVYGLISVLAAGLGGVLNFFYSRNFVTISFKDINPLRHIKDLKIFFVHTLVVNLYTSLDQPLLGFLDVPTSVAFINRSKAVTGMAISVSTAISNATYSRASYYMNNDKTKFTSLVKVVPNYILWITVPMTFGIMYLAPQIMFILGGEEFVQASLLLQIVAPTIIFGPLSTYLQNQILLPTGNEKIGLHVAVLSVIASLGLNLSLIPKIGVIGAGIATVTAEFVAVTVRYLFIVKSLRIELKLIGLTLFKFLVAGIVMLLSLMFVAIFISNTYIFVLIAFIVGVVVYISVLFLLKESTTFFILNLLKGYLNNFKKKY
ncbi:flippase [Aerococcus viridans]|uniref:flippase n=1 Tax=Aerococcus viridans TaxID=1377 RepID=UPI0002F3D223|nr:flippase [Aerococcus viridans]